MPEEPLEPLSPVAAELLGFEQHREGPPDAVTERLLARVQATAALPAPGAAPSAGAASGVAGKVIGALALAAASGLLGAAVMAAMMQPRLEDLQRRLDAAEAQLARRPAEPAAAAPMPAAPSVEEDVPAPKPPPRAPAPKRADSTLTAEAALLERARTALLRQDAAAALGALEQHAAAHPKGQLAEEREALAVQALVSLGRVSDAEARAAAFRERWPSSLLLPAVEATLQSAR